MATERQFGSIATTPEAPCACFLPCPCPDKNVAETPRPADDANRPGEVALHVSDLDLIRLVMQRETIAIDRFVVRMQCVPRFVAARNAHWGRPLSDEAIEDVVQDVLAVVWKKLPTYQGEAGLETWVYQFCEFELRNAVRRAGPRRTLSLADHVEPIDTTPERAMPADDLAPVYAAMENLAAEDVRIIRLKHFEEHTFDSIALRLALSVNTVKTRYYRAIEKLRRRLGRSEGTT